jgi:hypothetical protein
MSERKVLRYNYAFQQVCPASGQFNRDISVPFVPDEVKIRQIGFYSVGTAVDVLSLSCDSLVGQSSSNLGFFVDAGVFFPGITYPLSRSPNGSHTFTVLTSVQAAVDGATLALHLEFRKYV